MAPANPPQASCRAPGIRAARSRHASSPLEVQSSAKEPHDELSYLPLIGRVLIGLPFAMSGLVKLAAYGPATAMIGGIGLPFPPLAFGVAGPVELGGPR
jgi:hypothetical protein